MLFARGRYGQTGEKWVDRFEDDQNLPRKKGNTEGEGEKN